MIGLDKPTKTLWRTSVNGLSTKIPLEDLCTRTRFARYPKIISAQGFYARSLDNSLQKTGRVDEKFPNTSKYDARHEILKYLKVKTGKLQEKHQKFCKCNEEWTLGMRALAIHAKPASFIYQFQKMKRIARPFLNVSKLNMSFKCTVLCLPTVWQHARNAPPNTLLATRNGNCLKSCDGTQRSTGLNPKNKVLCFRQLPGRPQLLSAPWSISWHDRGQKTRRLPPGTRTSGHQWKNRWFLLISYMVFILWTFGHPTGNSNTLI